MKKIIIFLNLSLLFIVGMKASAQRRGVGNVRTSNAATRLNARLLDTTCTSTFIQRFTNLAGTGNSSTGAISKVNIFPNPSGGFYITGLRNDSTTISYFDKNDIIRWTKMFKFSPTGKQQINSMFLNTDGDLIGITDNGILPAEGYIFKYNILSSSFIWVKKHSLLHPFIHSANINDCIITGTIYNSSNFDNTYLLRIDKSSGSSIQFSLMGERGNYYSIVQNNKIYGTCRRYETGDDFRASLFVHDINNGSFLWQRMLIAERNPTIIQTRMYPVAPVYDNDSLLVFASGDINGFNQYNDDNLEVALTKTDTLGTSKWNIQYNFPFSKRVKATAITNTSDGYFLVGSFYNTTLSAYSHSYVVKINKNGGVIWAKKLGITGRNEISKVLEQNGNLYVCMSSKSYSTTDDLLLIKMDKNGNTDSSCHLIADLDVDTIQLQRISNDRPYNTSTNNMNLVATPTNVDSLKIEPETICIKCCKKKVEIIPNHINGKYCFGDSLCFSIKVNDSLNLKGGYKYKWYQKNSLGNWVITNSVDTIPNPCISYSAIGILTYRVIVSTNSGLCQDTSEKTITINPKPIANSGLDAKICPPQSTTIGVAATSGNTYSWSSIPTGFTSTLANPSVSPSVATTYYLTVTNTNTQCVAKDTVVISINNNCNPPPTCITCSTKVATTSTVSLTSNTNLSATNLVQSFSFTGLPANITEVRATVTNVKLFAVDENGKIKEECLSCKNEARTWASIINGSGIIGVTPKININGVETDVPVTLAPDINARNVTWQNTAAFSINSPVELSFLLPQKSTLHCCTRKATICVKFVFRNDKCEECIATKCFDVEIK